MYGELMDKINSLLSVPIQVGSLPPNNGMAMYIGSGSVDQIHLDKGSTNQLSLVVNSKHINQLTCLDNLSRVQKELTLRTQYPTGTEFEITDISISTIPNLIGQEESSGQYMYGSIFQVDFYIKGDE